MTCLFACIYVKHFSIGMLNFRSLDIEGNRGRIVNFIKCGLHTTCVRNRTRVRKQAPDHFHMTILLCLVLAVPGM